MNHIRRAFALTAAAAMAAMAAIVTVAASACGGATTATGPPTNGLEKKSPADVLHAAAAALRAAKSVHIVGADLDGHFDYRMQGSSAIGTITQYRADLQIRIRVIGRDAYERIDRGHYSSLSHHSLSGLDQRVEFSRRRSFCICYA